MRLFTIFKHLFSFQRCLSFKICKWAKWWCHTLNQILINYDGKGYLSQFYQKFLIICSKILLKLQSNQEKRTSQEYINEYYYMATIVHALWLAAERALWNFSRLDCSFELWVKLHARGRKQQKRWTKYNYIFNNWKKN